MITVTADRITFTDDGRAWLVVPEMLDPHTFDVTDALNLDRPCDTCHGTGANQPDEDYDDINLAWATDDETADLYDCLDCINGWHTFTIEMEADTDWDVIYNAPPTTRIYRVSVVPGMVLPIVDGMKREPRPPKYIINIGGWQMSDGDLSTAFFTPITLPPDTKPGDDAVQLQVHQNGEK